MPLMDFLARVVDKGEGVDCSKRGDFLDVKPTEGVEWSPDELSNDDWRIIRADVLPTFALAVISPPRVTVLRYFRRRDWFCDFDLLPNPELYKGARTQSIIRVKREQLTAATRKKG